MTDRFELATADGERLEGRWDRAQAARGVVVFCHADPTQRGTMNSPLMIAVARRLAERGHDVVRFNFRGTGASTGSHDQGRNELLDVDAAYHLALSRDLPVAIAGWSFGAAVALRWLAEREAAIPYVGIAPPPQLLPEQVPSGPKRIILGTREQVVDAEAVSAYAAIHSIDLVLTPGDHFFHGRGQKIGDLVAQGLEQGN